MATLAEMLRQGADRLVELPNDARRFMTNPQAFTQLVTGKNPMPRETGFAAGAMGIPANSENIEYQQGFQQGEPYELPIALASMGAPLVVPAAKALAPKAAQMAENYMVKQGFMPSVVPQTRKEVLLESFNKIAGGEKPVRSAVVLIGDKIFTGNTHTQAFDKAIQEGVIRKEGKKFIYPKDAEVNSDLFMLNDGRIVDRLEASKMLDIGASETAIKEGKMQIRPAKSMQIDEYMRQAEEIKNAKTTQ
jgi:hypothetical protein